MKGSECKLRSPGINALVNLNLNLDSGRTVIIGTKRTCGEVIRQGGGGDEGFMIFWHSQFLGWIVCWKHGAEKTVESALEYETNVADLHGPIWICWSWIP